MQVSFHVKIDKEIKDKAIEIAKAYGLTLNELVNISLRNTLENGILFEALKKPNTNSTD
jgi:antitoxin component of RelBE/YafQ-DinJ toxin-antitoxin module